jgi:hypothetical protein
MTITILDIIHRPIFYLKHNLLGDWILSLSSGISYPVGPTDRASLSLRSPASLIQSQSYIATDGQSASLSWCQAPIWGPRPIFLFVSLIIFRQLRVCWTASVV